LASWMAPSRVSKGMIGSTGPKVVRATRGGCTWSRTVGSRVFPVAHWALRICWPDIMPSNSCMVDALCLAGGGREETLFMAYYDARGVLPLLPPLQLVANYPRAHFFRLSYAQKTQPAKLPSGLGRRSGQISGGLLKYRVLRSSVPLNKKSKRAKLRARPDSRRLLYADLGGDYRSRGQWFRAGRIPTRGDVVGFELGVHAVVCTDSGYLVLKFGQLAALPGGLIRDES